MNLLGTYAGVVENIKDPEKLGRVKVRVPMVHGISGSGAGYIGTNDLPWALPAGMPAGGSAASGGFSHLPERGDKVWVRFLDGEPEKPLWEWGMQSQSDAQALKLHSYESSPVAAVGAPTAPSVTGTVGKPERAFWTRYGHGVELNAGSVIVTTSKGYRLQLIDGDPTDGQVRLSTGLGSFLQFDDLDKTGQLFVLEDLTLNVGDNMLGYSASFDWYTLSGDFSVDSVEAIKMTSANGIELTTTTDFTLDALQAWEINGATTGKLYAPQVEIDGTQIQLGAGAVEPAVLGTQLTLFLNTLLLYLSTHVHTSSTPGSPTSPPVTPPTPLTTITSTKVFVV